MRILHDTSALGDVPRDGILTGPHPSAQPGPTVSVIMANHNGATFLNDAINAVLKQSLSDLELILVDDGSQDASISIMNRAAARDRRVQVYCISTNLGPAGARNVALSRARGRWIAIVDSDDLLHPRRFEWLVAAAEADGADIAADDAMLFEEHNAFPPKALLGADNPRWISTAEYIANNALFHPGVALGYLKPIFRAITLPAAMRYNPNLRIAEDYDLVARMLMAGAKFRAYPQLTYFYRKHANSISHRMPATTLQAMLDADTGSRSPGLGAHIVAALDSRRQSIVEALAFTMLVGSLKQWRPMAALKIALASPRGAALLRYPIIDRLKRKAAPKQTELKTGRDVCLISRQRVIGYTNGSSAYLLNLCETIAGLGLRIHLVCPSPVMFGRWPFLVLHPEMALFQTIKVRGAVRFGRYVVALNPRIFWVAVLTVANRLAKRAHLTRSDWVPPAPYAIGAPWTRDDYLFVAQHAREHADFLLADYAFLTNGFPYALRPDAPSAVVMHDLFSSRVSQFAQSGNKDSVTEITAADEMALLSQADAVIAIQSDEAEQIRRQLPRQLVITVPMACTPELAPSPGTGLEVLFVGSGTAPNVIGLRWFIENSWPQIRQRVPGATLVVVGGISHAVDRRTPGINVLGQLPRLTDVYKRAAVVISPLLAGSGLKIKLVEALSFGKAAVATAATLQGFGPDVHAAVTEAETPEAFAEGVVQLLLDPALRTRRGQAGLELANRLFSPTTCHRSLVKFIERRLTPAEGNRISEQSEQEGEIGFIPVSRDDARWPDSLRVPT